jgi:hypothetical protein
MTDVLLTLLRSLSSIVKTRAALSKSRSSPSVTKSTSSDAPLPTVPDFDPRTDFSGHGWRASGPTGAPLLSSSVAVRHCGEHIMKTAEFISEVTARIVRQFNPLMSSCLALTPGEMRGLRATSICRGSVINCCYAARGIRVSSTTTKTIDCPNLTFSENQRTIACGKISLNVSRRVVSLTCIAGVLTSPNFRKLQSTG